jgi:hypothetical protein
MRIRRILPGVAVTLLLLIAAVAIWLLNPSNEVIIANELEGVIFHRNNASKVLGYMLTNEQSIEAYWNPTKADILEMEKEFTQYLQVNLPEIAPKLSSYKRQYFGFNREGVNLIFIVGFCELLDVNWRSELVALSEETDCYFEAQYDASNNTFLYAWTH